MKKPFNLTQHLAQQSAVINHAGTTISGKKLLSWIENAYQKLFKTDYQHVALCFDDSLRFIIMLLATLAAGRTPILLPNNQLGTIEQFRKEYDALYTDNDITLDDKTEISNMPLAINTEHAIVLFTSGSTGTPKKVIRPLKYLLNEINAFEKLFHEEIANSVVYSTVSHQHIYGLISFILWPLIAGRTIMLPRLQFPEQVIAAIQKESAMILISNPTLLSRTFHHPLKIEKLTIISSGSALKQEDAVKIQHCVGSAPIELYGSTETSGIAYRQQNEKTDAHWQPFPTVKINIDKETACLTVVSDFFPHKTPFITADHITLFDDQTFLLHGRADRIVKIEGKRASLTELEEKLNTHPFVKESFLVSLENHRQYIGAAVVLNTDGEKFISKNEKHKLNQNLKQHLRQFFDAALLPKKFRYLDELPKNSQGKYNATELKKLFE